MMDWRSYSKVNEEIIRVIQRKVPEMDPEVLKSLSRELTSLTQKEVYEYSGCKIPFKIYNEIKAAWNHGVKQKDLVEKYKISAAIISKICNDKLIVKNNL